MAFDFWVGLLFVRPAGGPYTPQDDQLPYNFISIFLRWWMGGLLFQLACGNKKEEKDNKKVVNVAENESSGYSERVKEIQILFERASDSGNPILEMLKFLEIRKDMAECHRCQIVESKILDESSLSEKQLNKDNQIDAIIKLKFELQNWNIRFSDWIQAQSVM
ncbi:hypothetical protein PIB30_004121 [Stylosanthes scabra]|uniref:DUF632 domain-containing protein n=1 Tax=Stylosanthes scabra TaxID=79078 RepID=A0ABU6Q3D8_9FABA|nr:hypothetical protein [Stylosanthes scabra]